MTKRAAFKKARDAFPDLKPSQVGGFVVDAGCLVLSSDADSTVVVYHPDDLKRLINMCENRTTRPRSDLSNGAEMNESFGRVTLNDAEAWVIRELIHYRHKDHVDNSRYFIHKCTKNDISEERCKELMELFDFGWLDEWFNGYEEARVIYRG